jgi:hypothetical protein
MRLLRLVGLPLAVGLLVTIVVIAVGHLASWLLG